MAGVTRRRARSPEDKAARRRAVLDEAWRLFQGRPWSELTMAQVAKGVGLSKAALYRYFDTKEALFLAVVESRLEAWLGGLGRQLDALARPARAEAVADVLCASLAARPALVRLLSLLHVALEQNLPQVEALRFKRALHAALTRTGEQLAGAAGLDGSAAGLQAVLAIHALIIGLWQVSDIPPRLARLLEEGELQELRVSFQPALRQAVAALLRGLATPGQVRRAARSAR
jgi:AcrR family transcriptional regulator